MKKTIIILLAITLFSGSAYAKEVLQLTIENKKVKFNHKGHIKYNHGNCNVCHPKVPQSLEPEKVNWMFCRSCHDQSLETSGLKLQPIKK
jgi:cytochrome c553